MENNTLQDFASTSPRIRMSGTEIRPKEVILVLLALALLVFSIGLFFKHWSKNYREINTLPYYAYLYKDDPEIPEIPAVSSQGEILVEEALSRTPSSRLLSRSRHSSFRTTSMEPISPSNGHRPLRLKSFKRNRPSFIHVTAEAMQRQKSCRLHTSPWEYRSTKNRRRTVPVRTNKSSFETVFVQETGTAIQDQPITEEKVVSLEMSDFSKE